MINFTAKDGTCLLGGTEKECINDCTMCELAIQFLNGEEGTTCR